MDFVSSFGSGKVTTFMLEPSVTVNVVVPVATLNGTGDTYFAVIVPSIELLLLHSG